MNTRSLIFTTPSVYVYPPEEDRLPAYCCFDAAQLHSSDSSLSFLDSDYIQYSSQAAPLFHRGTADIDDVIMPKKSIDQPFVDDDDFDYGQDITIRGNEPGDFSEVVEVVKVKRRSDKDARKSSTAPVSQQPFKRSQTFMSRAFRSIKNVNRTVSSRGKKPQQPAHEVDSSSTSSTTPYDTTPRAQRSSRRGSVALLDLFSPSTPKSRSSVDSITQSIPSRPKPLNRSSSSILGYRTSSSSLSSEFHTANDDVEPFDSLRSPSPTPSAQTFSVRKRFSVLNLFSFGNASASTIPTMTSAESLGTIPPTCSSSLHSYSSSIEPTRIEATPYNPATPFSQYEAPPEHSDMTSPPVPPKGSNLLRRIPSFRKKGPKTEKTEESRKDAGSGQHRQENRDIRPPDVLLGDSSEAGNQGDISFEMRLDSLHFDDLSFDAEKF